MIFGCHSKSSVCLGSQNRSGLSVKPNTGWTQIKYNEFILQRGKMRALAVSIWVFINLVFFGMCGYMYLLWSQYWMYMERQTETTTSIYDQQIYYYNRGYYPSDVIPNKTINKPLPENRPRKKHSIHRENSTVTLIKNSKPRYETRIRF